MSEFGGKLDEHFDNIYRSNVLSMEQYEENIGLLSHLLYVNRDSFLVEEALSQHESLTMICEALTHDTATEWHNLLNTFQNLIVERCEEKAVELYRKYGDKAYDYV